MNIWTRQVHPNNKTKGKRYERQGETNSATTDVATTKTLHLYYIINLYYVLLLHCLFHLAVHQKTQFSTLQKHDIPWPWVQYKCKTRELTYTAQQAMLPRKPDFKGYKTTTPTSSSAVHAKNMLIHSQCTICAIIAKIMDLKKWTKLYFVVVQYSRTPQYSMRLNLLLELMDSY